MSNAALQREITHLKADVDRLASERQHYHDLYLEMLETCRKLEQGILGQKRERLPENEAQLTLDVLSALLDGQDPSTGDAADRDDDQPDGAAGETPVAAHTRRKAKRKPLPENLPRVEVTVLPPEVERLGLDAFVQIGEEVAEVIERRQAGLVVVRTRRPKFVPKGEYDGAVGDCLGQVLIAEPADLPIPKGIAGPGMLADTIVHRWQDHLPLNRLEALYKRDGLELARSTMCGWHEQLAGLARPLVDAMWADARGQPYLCTDATGVLVQAKQRCRRGHFWVVIAPGLHVLFGYSKKHDAKAVDRLLGGYEGYLVADAHVVYDHLYKDGDVVEVGCWAHARRYFFKAMSSDPDRARQALAMIGGLFRIEREVADAGRKKREQVRERKSKPIVDRFFAWCDEQVPQVLDDTPIKRGLGYARNQREALERFIADGRLPLHNNGSERELRRQAVGRKNWLFVGSDNGAETNAVFTTLLASCQMHDIEPWRYLRDLFILLPNWPKSRVLDLAPAYWSETRDTPEATRPLAVNPYRIITRNEDLTHHEHIKPLPLAGGEASNSHG